MASAFRTAGRHRAAGGAAVASVSPRVRDRGAAWRMGAGTASGWTRVDREARLAGAVIALAQRAREFALHVVVARIRAANAAAHGDGERRAQVQEIRRIALLVELLHQRVAVPP